MSGVRDVSGNPIAEIAISDAIQVANFTEDRTAPQLVAFDLDMNSTQLTLVFDETVNTSSLNVQGIVLQQFNDSLGEYRVLSLPSYTNDPDSTTFVIQLSRQDSNEIKRMTSLAISSTSVFIAIRNFTIADMNGNYVTEVPVDNAIAVRDYTVDETRPELESFHLDLNTNQLILTFDETVDVYTLEKTYITLHSDVTVNDSSRFQVLTGGRVLNTDNSHVLYLEFVLEDINNVKLYPEFGTDVSNTYLTVLDFAVQDLSYLNPNGLVGTTLQASNVTGDNVSPRLRIFTVDLNSEQMTLYFNEPVNVSTFIASGLTVQNAGRSRTGVRLTNSISSSGNGQTIVVSLSEEDLNEIQRIDALFIDQDTSFITVMSELIQDMSGNAVVPILNGFALPASGYIEDMNRPDVISYNLDMDEGYVTIFFSETTNVSSIMCDQLRFSRNVECTVNYTLTDCIIDTRNVTYDSEDVGMSGSGSAEYGSAPRWITPFHYATSISFWLTLNDLNQLKVRDIARDVATTYLSYSNTTILDQNNLPLLERECYMMARPINADDYIPDTTSPELVSFNISINEGVLVFSFTETVMTSTLQVREIVLQNAPSINNSTQTHTLGVDRSTESFNGPTDIITIFIAPGDFNRIKFLADLAVSNETTYLSATSMTVVDTKGNTLVFVSPFDALQVTNFDPDVTPPVLVSYDLDMNFGILRLTFNETVNIDSLNFTRLTLQAVPDLSVFNNIGTNLTNETVATNATNSSGSGSGVMLIPFDVTLYEDCDILFLELNGGATLSTLNSTVLLFELTLDDLNDIKRETCLATSPENTFLSLEKEAILDMNNNRIETVDRNDADRVNGFVEDQIRPNLVGFDLNLTSEILTLYFDETVNASSFDPTQISLLSDSISIVSINISTEVNSTDFNNDTNINSTLYETFEYLTSEFNYTLTGGELLQGDDPKLYVRLSKDDLNTIKYLTDLATDSDNTFISITDMLVRDMNRNQVNEITHLNALMVQNFTEDQIPPTLISFDLDLDRELLTLTFDETVNVTSLNFSGITLLSETNTTTPEQYWALNGGPQPLYSYSASPNQPVIQINIGYFDINEIKRLTQLATSNESTYLSISMGATLDMNGNAVVPISFESAIQVINYTEDVTQPQLVRFDLDLDDGTLTLEFSETVNASSLVLPELVIQNVQNSLESYLTVYNSSVLLEDSVFLYVNFGIDFLNELKRLIDLATEQNNTYLSFPSSALLDMNNNQVFEILNSSAEVVYNFTADTNRPNLNSFDLDMNMGTLILYFNETVRVSTINTTFITLSQFPYTVMEPGSSLGPGQSGMGSGLTSSSGSGSGSADNSESYTLSGGYVQLADSHTVQINITLFDLNEIKKLRNLATRAGNTFVLLTSEALDDMYSNLVVPIEEDSGLQVSRFVDDTTPPDVDMYHLDMNLGRLTILFTETVDTRTLVIPDRITFYNTSDFVGSLYTLIDSTSESEDGPLIVIDLSPLDLNQLKFIRDLASNPSDTFLFLNNTVLDMVGNVLTPLYMGLNETRPADQFTTDTTSPELIEFNFDLDSGQLHLTFSEVVDNINVTSLTFQNEQNETNTITSFTLIGYSQIYGPSLLPRGPGYPPELTIVLSFEDLNEVKRLRELAVSSDTTFLSLTSSASVDAFNLNIVPISIDDSLPVTTWTPDTTSPQLVSFDISTDTGLLSLTFDETVSVETFNATTVSFVNPFTGTGYTLQYQPPYRNATLSEDDSTIVDLQLANDDLNQLKFFTDIATYSNDTFILMEQLTIMDLSENELNVSNLPLQVRNHTPDTTPPELLAFDLDMDTTTLVLYFSETVNVSSLDISQLTLHPSQFDNTTNSSYRLLPSFEYPQGTVTRSPNGPVIVLDLGQMDSNNIKRIETLATSSSVAFITITSDAIQDMVGLPVVDIEVSDARRVQTFVEDATDPVLLSFEFDLDSSLLTLTFNETVNISSIDQNSIIFQNSQLQPSESHALTMGVAEGFNDPVVFFPLRFYDLNQLKLMRMLAIHGSNTFLNILDGMILDMASNPSDPNVLQASNFTDDTTRPYLTNFLVDLNISLLILNFNEPVDRRTLDTTQITFQSSPARSSDPDLFYTLQESDSNSTDGLTIHVMIHNNDLNEIKERPGLLVSPDTAYISLTENLISDMRGNVLVPIIATNATQAEPFVEDLTRPHLVTYHLDMDASRLHLTFLETVNASSINFTSFALQADSNVVDEQMRYRLTGGDLESYNASTVVSIIITLDDLNEIKARQIATSTQTSWLAVDSTGIMDQNDLPIVPLQNGINTQQATRYTIDTTRPELRAYWLDLNTGDITFSFSETVRSRSLNLTTITVQNAQQSTGITNMYSVSELGTRQNSDGPIITVRLSDFDLNEIKRRPLLATDVGSTFITVRSSTVFDMQMNYLVPIPNGGALQVSAVTPDMTLPRLVQFNLDMDSANLTLTFDEAVNASSLASSGITFSSPSIFVPSYTLTGGFVISCFGTVVTVNLNDYDFDLLKIQESLCTGILEDDCILTIDADSIVDMSGNRNANSSVTPAIMITQDTTNPYLVYYDLDLTDEQLRLTFSEVVRTSSDTPFGITLLTTPFEFDARDNSSEGVNIDENDPESYRGLLRAYTLSGGILGGPNEIPDHPPVLYINLTDKDLNILKSLESVATSMEDTYLLIISESVQDYYQNTLTAIDNSFGKRVRVFTPDQTRPQLTSYDFDLDSGELFLTFSETVDRSTLQTNGISLQGSSNASNTDIYTLSGGSSISYNNPIILVTLSTDNLNEVKRRTMIAANEGTTYLSLLSFTISDQDQNPVVEISDDRALFVQSGGFTPDTTRPTLVQFSLDLNTGRIHLTFDETINSSTFMIDTLTLSNNVNITDTNLTLSEGTLLTNDSTVLSYLINDDDLNEIKRVDMCSAFAGGEDCFLVFTNVTVLDMSGNSVVEREDGDAVQVDPYVMDITAPEIVYFSVNMSLGNFTLSFSETVNISTFDPRGIILHEHPNRDFEIRLSGGTLVTTENGLSVDFYLNKEDLEFLRRNEQLYVIVSNSLLTAEPSTISDMSGNPLAQSDDVIADSFYSDTIGPRVIGAVLDLTRANLELTFSETIRSTSFRPNEITLLNSNDTANTNISQYTFTGGEIIPNAPFDSPIISFNITPSDLLEIQARETLAVSLETSYILYNPSVATDLAEVDNRAEVIPPFRVTEFIDDTIDPDVFEFLELDLELRQLVLEFNEPVDISTANASLFTLQEVNRNIFGDGASITLIGGTFSYRGPDINQKRVIILSLNTEDYMRIVLENRIATEVGDTFISLPSGSVLDFAGNPLIDIPPTNGRGVVRLIPDLTNPDVVGFALDVDAGLLTFEFNNVVNVATLMSTAVTIQDGASSTVSHTLTDGTSNSTSGYSIMLYLTTADLNEIKRLIGIATSESNTYITVAAEFIRSHGGALIPFVGGEGVDIRAITNGNGLQVDSYTPDTTDPFLANFDLDLDLGELSLTFDETVNASSLDLTEIVLQNTPGVVENDTRQFTLTIRNVSDPMTVSTQDDSTVVTIALGFEDMNDIKRFTDLAIDNSTTYIFFSNATIVDMNDNPVIEIPSDSAQQVDMFTQDRTSPQLVNFDLDMDVGLLSLTFTETVNVSSLFTPAITLQNMSSGGIPVGLTELSMAISNNDYIVCSL